MPEFQNNEQIISHYKKVILPLESLVKVANITVGIKITVTINVNGTMIIGDVVPLREFHEHTSKLMMRSVERGNDPDTIQNMRGVMKAMERMYSTEELQDLIDSYVCIRNPTFFVNGETQSDKDMFWIGKIESVDGFMIGRP